MAIFNSYVTVVISRYQRVTKELNPSYCKWSFLIAILVINQYQRVMKELNPSFDGRRLSRGFFTAGKVGNTSATVVSDWNAPWLCNHDMISPVVDRPERSCTWRCSISHTPGSVSDCQRIVRDGRASFEPCSPWWWTKRAEATLALMHKWIFLGKAWKRNLWKHYKPEPRGCWNVNKASSRELSPHAHSLHPKTVEEGSRNANSLRLA